MTKSESGAGLTEGNVGWAAFGCRVGNFGAWGQAKRDPALDRNGLGWASGLSASGVTTPDPKRSQYAVERGFRILSFVLLSSFVIHHSDLLNGCALRFQR